MTPDVSDLLKKAFSPPAGGAHCLSRIAARSLDDPPDPGVQVAWDEEINRRIEEIDSGKVQMIPYEEVRRRIAALLSDASK